MQTGALGYVEKQVLDSELFVAIRTVASGGRYLSPQNAIHTDNVLNMDKTYIIRMSLPLLQ